MKNKGRTSFSIEELNRWMENMNAPQFSYDTLKAAHDTDPRIAELIKDFTQDTVELKTSEVDDVETDKRPKKSNTVSAMAKKAVDLNDL